MLGSMKRILITNDDGFEAQGIRSLAMAFASRYDVYVVAPTKERSGVSHAFTIREPISCEPAPGVYPDGAVRGSYRCSGTPADCVKIALNVILRTVEFDLVLSGINHGANLGLDTLYSGTVAGAREGSIQGIPAVAVSMAIVGSREHQQPHHFDAAARQALLFVESHHHLLRDVPHRCINLNVPVGKHDPPRGVKITRLAHGHVRDAYVEEPGSGGTRYTLKGEFVEEKVTEGTDVHAVRSGYVSITPLHHDLTDQALMGEMASGWPLGGTGPGAG